MKKRAIWINTGVIGLSIILTGCGVFQGEQSAEKVDQSEDVNYVEDLEEAETKQQEGEDRQSSEQQQEEASESVTRQLYLLDANGMVVPQELELPKAESKQVAKQSLEYLVKDGPVTELLPDGFQAVLPAGTQIKGLNLKEKGTMVVDVSNEFTEYQPENEQKILEAMTYTLTQFENVERVKLWINGHEQTEMPVNGTPISKGYSRANGINIHEGNATDLLGSKAVTLYYPSQQGDQSYHVPVTQHVDTEEESSSNYQSIVQALVDGPSFDLNLLNVFANDTELAEEPTYEDGVLTLTFNEAILNEKKEKASVSNDIMKTLVLTLTDQEGVDAVNVKVDNVDQVFDEEGNAYSEPITRDKFVPTESL